MVGACGCKVERVCTVAVIGFDIKKLWWLARASKGVYWIGVGPFLFVSGFWSRQIVSRKILGYINIVRIL